LLHTLGATWQMSEYLQASAAKGATAAPAAQGSGPVILHQAQRGQPTGMLLLLLALFTGGQIK
jgi:hypothetical protein